MVGGRFRYRYDSPAGLYGGWTRDLGCEVGKIEADGEEQWADVVRIARSDGLGELANSGLTMAEGKLALAGLQKKFVAWQSQDRGGQAAIAACGC
jgi:hypothetical protein